MRDTREMEHSCQPFVFTGVPIIFGGSSNNSPAPPPQKKKIPLIVLEQALKGTKYTVFLTLPKDHYFPHSS